MVRFDIHCIWPMLLCSVAAASTPPSDRRALELSSLPEFIHDVFAQLTSTNDTTFEAALDNFYSPQLQASDVTTSSQLTRSDFGAVVQGLRAELSQRQLINEIFVLATPIDQSNQTGGLAATHILSAVQVSDGQPVIATIASLLRVEWVGDSDAVVGADGGGGRRQVVAEALITSVEPNLGQAM
ncbi:hypothetical protein FB45DRAFT_939138 [Roridomyces roridus]|uniref:SnoaL-like domain-containing protein n=1 Tax=Roridomyces roridus TaxID=1738132 RepID=A0AAD7B7S5_9AGAR|nr:hypothetical protein FB45DRAFT_939138 [Roridomyces roridus]